jgi:hypothetical protein
MRELLLTQGKVARVDDADYPLLSQWKWGYLPNKRSGYAVRWETRGGVRRTIYMHRQIMGAERGQLVDHEDGDGLNNQRYNLRMANETQNLANRPTRERTIAYRGVYPNNKGRTLPYKAQIKAYCRNWHLGSYLTQEQAARAYDRAALHFFGSFARLNFPDAIEATQALPLYRTIAGPGGVQLALPLDEADFPESPKRKADWLEYQIQRKWRAQRVAQLPVGNLDDDLL